MGGSKVTFPKKTIKDISVHGKTVLLRADFNVPLDDDGKIDDDYRLTQTIPTLEYLIERDAKVVICTHLDKPHGKTDPKLSLEPVARRLGHLMDRHVAFVPECIGDRVKQAVKHARPGQILLLENLRFHIGEEENEAAFAQRLFEASGASIFVQDAFGSVHRKHASTDAITRFLPSVSGLLLKREYVTLRTAMQDPESPFVAILGGAKTSDKIQVIDELIRVADHIIIGGAMANTFLKYNGLNIGKSLYELGMEKVIDSIYRDAAKKVGGKKSIGEFIVLPTDVAVSAEVDESERRATVSVGDVKENDHIVDIGPETINRAANLISQAKTVIWGGTLGVSEIDQFAVGSIEVAKQLVRQPDTTSIIGGGDTADFVLHWDRKKGGSFTHVSTGGSASLELMAGNKLPGIEALLDA